MTRFVSLLILIIAFTAFSAMTYHVLRARVEAGREMPDYSVYSKERNGLWAAATFLRNGGWEPVALTRPIQHTRYGGLLILAQPGSEALVPGMETDLSEPDARGLLRWVENGNTLLLAGRGMGSLHEELGVRPRHTRSADREEITTRAEPAEAGIYTDGIDRIVVEGHDVFEAGTGVPLWWLDDQPGAVLIRRGKGRVFVIADPTLLTQRGLDRPDTKIFLHNVVAARVPLGRQVYFDEYHHGLRSGGGFWGYVRYYEQGWAVLPVLLVVGVAVWSLAIRLGPAVPTPRARSADAVEYASALARIYENAGVRQLLSRTLIAGFRGALTRHLRLRRTALPAEILAAWRRRHPTQPADQLEMLLRGASELRRADVPTRRLQAWTEVFDRFENEVLRAKRS